MTKTGKARLFLSLQSSEVICGNVRRRPPSGGVALKGCFWFGFIAKTCMPAQARLSLSGMIMFPSGQRNSSGK
eukprot:364259-Chlamydomonas_euryale.AAC.6